MRTFRLLLVGLVASAATVSFAQDLDPIDKAVVDSMEVEHIPGVVIGILKNGKIIDSRAYGFADLEQRIPMTVDKGFRIASISKQMVATVTHHLVAENRLSMEDPVAKFFPALARKYPEVKVRHLLTHTAGVADVTSFSEFQYSQNYGTDGMIELILSREPDFAPGSAYKYSNSNFALMGLILEKVSGTSLRFLLRDRLFNPLGMKESFVYRDYEDVSNVSVGYRWENGKFLKSGTKRPIELDGSGSVVSTLTDLAKWDAALYTDFPLTEKMKAIAWAPTPLTTGKTSNYGTGWTTGLVDGLRMISHGGSTLGYTAAFIRLYDKQISVIVLRNGAGKNALPLARKILSEVAGIKPSQDGSGSL